MIININSQDRQSGTNEEFAIDFGVLAQHHAKNGGRISMKTAEIPYSWYTMRNGVNNTFTYTDSNSAVKTIYLGSLTGTNEGSPSASVIIANLTTQLNVNTDSAVWTINIDSTTGKFFFSATKAWTFTFDPALETNDVLGFSTGVTTGVASTVFYPPHVANLAPNKYVYIRTNIPINSGHDFDSYSKNVSDIIAKIQINVNPYSNIYFEEKIMVPRICPTLHQCNFRLTDHKNRTLNLNGVPWSFSLQFHKL